MWKWSGILLAGSFILGSQAKARDPLLSLSLAQADGPKALLGVVPAGESSGTAAQSPALPEDRLSLAPPATMAFSSPMEILGSVTHYGAPIDAYLLDQSAIPPTYLSDLVEEMRLAFTSGDDPLAALGNIFDVADTERPWSTTTSIRLQAKTDEGLNRWVPFITVARELGAVEDRERLGVGGGMNYHITANTAFVTELLYFGDRLDSGNAWDRETRFTVGFQFTF
jgi:hypothetical protein